MLNSSAMQEGRGRAVTIGVLIFVFALALRLVGIGWGLKNEFHNQSYHPDELPIFSQSQKIEPMKGNFVPGFYNYGTLYLTMLRVSSDAVSAVTGRPDDKPDSSWDWAARCQLVGRILSALAGAGTCLLVFMCALRFTTISGAALAGLFMAIAPGHVIHSRFQTVDVMALFFVACSTYVSLKLLSQPKPDDSEDGPELVRDRSGKGYRLKKDDGLKLAILAGLFAGLSAGTKYAGGLAILTFIAAVIVAKRKTWLREILLSIAVTVVAFLITTPGAILDRQRFMADLSFEAEHMAAGQGFTFAATPSAYLYHLQNLAVGIGALAVVVALGAWIWALVKKQPWAFALIAFWLPYYLLIGNSEVKFLRYTFPLYVGLAIAFGWGLGSLKAKGAGWIAGLASLIGIGSGGLLSTISATAQMSGEDSRDTATRYIRSVAKPDTKVGFARFGWYWSVPLFKDSVLPGTIPMDQRLQAMAENSTPPVVIAMDGDRPTIFDPRLIDELRPELIVYTSLESRDLERIEPTVPGLPSYVVEMVKKAKTFFVELPKSYTLDREIGRVGEDPEDMAYFNPAVRIWKRKP